MLPYDNATFESDTDGNFVPFRLSVLLDPPVKALQRCSRYTAPSGACVRSVFSGTTERVPANGVKGSPSPIEKQTVYSPTALMSSAKESVNFASLVERTWLVHSVYGVLTVQAK